MGEWGMEGKKVSVFIPARNEEGNVRHVIEKTVKAFLDNGLDGEIIFVNDGSTDGTRQEAEECARLYPCLKVINHRRSLGLTAAMRTGFRHISGDVVIFLPADMESDPEEDIPKLLCKMSEGYDVVAGWRQGRQDGKLLASKVYNFVSRLLFNLEAHDMNWIKAFRREVVEEIHLRSDWHRFILMIAAEKGYRIGEVKTNYYPRKRGKSKFGLGRLVISLLDVLVVKFLMTFSERPMLFFGSLALALIVGAGLIGLVLIYLWFAFYMQKRPFMLLAGGMFLAGLLLFLVGFLAELVVSQREHIEDLERAVRELSDRLDEMGNGS